MKLLGWLMDNGLMDNAVDPQGPHKTNKLTHRKHYPLSIIKLSIIKYPF